MISLFIDTSLANVSISVIRDNKILSNINENIPNMHSVYVTKYIKDALDKANIDANEVDNLMVVNGPGSFTGVRIGVTIAKTYGYLIKKDITPISSLKILAICNNHEDIILSLIPANKSSYYGALYDKNNNEIIKEQFMNKDLVIEICNKYKPLIVSNEVGIVGEYKISKQKLDVLKIVNYYIDKDKVNCFKIVPNYLKLPQALEGK